MIISMVTIIDENGAIGNKGKLLCHMPNDLKRFKELTKGGVVIMGKNTFYSLKEPLSDRLNIIISSSLADSSKTGENVKVFNSPLQALRYCQDQGFEEVFVIGGQKIYKEFMPIADRMYITLIKNKFEEFDTVFPLEKAEDWECVSRTQEVADVNPYDCFYDIYERKSK